MRVLVATHHRSFKARVPWRPGGVARLLAGAGHDVTVLCTADHARGRLREYTEDGVRMVEAPDLLWGRQRSGWDPWGGWQRSRWLAGREFDLIHVFETRPNVIHPLLRHRQRHPAPLVIDWCDWYGRGGLIEENRPGWYRALFGGIETYYEEHFRPLADATTLISRGLEPRALGLGVPAESIFWIPNGCWPDQVQPVAPGFHRARYNLPAEAFILGYSALDVNIGLDFVLAGFARAAARQPDLLLIVTGSGSAAAVRQARALGVAAQVRALGHVPTADYLPLLSCVDAFLLPFVDRPANHGRWPGRVNDYLTLGRPVITQPVAEMRRLLETHAVGVASDETPDGLAAAIAQLHGDRARTAALGAAARRLAETELRWSALLPRLEAAYACARERFAASKLLRRTPGVT